MTLLKEQLAKAFCEASGLYKWEDTPETMKQWYLAGIEAALKVMREPTEAMCNAKVPNTYDIEGIPMNEPGALDNTCATWVWKAMIDEALR